MKRYFILFALVALGSIAFSQEVCDDKIFTADGNKIILNCCIKRVVDGNIVVYSKGGETLRIPAVAISKNGEYMELFSEEEILNERYAVGEDKSGLYRGHGYSYYRQLYEGSQNRKTFGMVFTFLGLGLEATGLIMAENVSGALYFDNTARDVLRLGIIFQTVGVPLWISGAVRASNNKKAMKAIESRHELSIRATEYGIGLVYRF
jgi:hypothetical protein